jgi:hypothetical protein
MPIDDTRAVARLPNLEIEIRHRKVPEEGAEYLALSLKATPDLKTAVLWFDPLWPMRMLVAMNPWLTAWQWPMLPAFRLRREE